MTWDFFEIIIIRCQNFVSPCHGLKIIRGSLADSEGGSGSVVLVGRMKIIVPVAFSNTRSVKPSQIQLKSGDRDEHRAQVSVFIYRKGRR